MFCSKFPGVFFQMKKIPLSFSFFFRGRRGEKRNEIQCSPWQRKKSQHQRKKGLLVQEVFFFLYSGMYCTFTNPLLTIYICLYRQEV